LAICDWRDIVHLCILTPWRIPAIPEYSLIVLTS
jgi:hypothetical protein